MSERQRIDVWLYRARLAKSRAVASDMVNGGGVRLARDGCTRRLDKASATVVIGDVLVFALSGDVRMVKVGALGRRRGPPAEAKTLYRELAAHLTVGQDPLA